MGKRVFDGTIELANNSPLKKGTTKKKKGISKSLVLVGSNDMWTTAPNIASLLENPKEGFKYRRSSDVKVKFKCPDCSSIMEKRIDNVYRHGLSCPSCSDGVPFPEKLIYNLLTQCKINFKKEERFKWADRKKYDFYLPDHSTIIEVHGLQHYTESFESAGGKSLSEEKKNDVLKHKLAIDNNIKNYIVIDARKSDTEWIRESLEGSSLKCIIDMADVDWKMIEQLSLGSLVLKTTEFWNNGIKSTTEISRILNLSRVTITKYLKRTSKLGLCDYDPKKKSKVCKFGRNARKILQLDEEYTLIKEWNSAKEISVSLSVATGTVYRYCKNKGDTHFRWMYKTDYEKYIESLDDEGKKKIGINVKEYKKVKILELLEELQELENEREDGYFWTVKEEFDNENPYEMTFESLEDYVGSIRSYGDGHDTLDYLIEECGMDEDDVYKF